jgi:hypothetical protein
MHRAMVPTLDVCSQMQDICHLLYGDKLGNGPRSVTRARNRFVAQGAEIHLARRRERFERFLSARTRSRVTTKA